jgi:hypothetical protein
VEFCNEEIHDLSFSPNIIRMITYRMREAGNVWRGTEIRSVLLAKTLREKDTLEELGVVGRITLLNKSK